MISEYVILFCIFLLGDFKSSLLALMEDLLLKRLNSAHWYGTCTVKAIVKISIIKKYIRFCPSAFDYQIEKAISWINNQLKKDILETYFARVARSPQCVRFKLRHYLQKPRKTSPGYLTCVLNNMFTVSKGRDFKLYLYAWEGVLSRTSASCYLGAIIGHIHCITCFCYFSEPWIFILWSYFLWLSWLVSCTLIDT